jgi:hypothetical protein
LVLFSNHCFLHRVELANGALPASRDAYRFVVVASKGSDDGLLPGLCMLTERWLNQVCMAMDLPNRVQAVAQNA